MQIGAVGSRLVMISVLLLLGSSATLAADASAAMSLVTVKGVTLSLPAKGSDTDFIYFLNNAGRPMMTLRQAIDDTDGAQQYFDNSDTIRVYVQAAPEPDKKFLGNLDRANFHSVEVEFLIGQNASVDCQMWSRKMAELRSSLTSSGKMAASDGWTRLDDQSDSTQTFYLAQTTTDKRTIDDLQCDDLHRCRSSHCLAPGIAMTYHFSDNVIDRSQWPATIRHVYQLADRVVLNQLSSLSRGSRALR